MMDYSLTNVPDMAFRKRIQAILDDIDTRLSQGGGGGGITDHGALSGRDDDDHTQYFNQARGDARYHTQSHIDAALADKANNSHTHTGTYQPLAAVLTNTTASYTTAEETKLAGIEANATADQTGAEIVSAIDTELGQTDWKSGGGGGSSTAVVQRARTTGGATSAALSVMDFNVGEFLDTGFSYNAGVVTIGSELNGLRAVVDVQMSVVYANRSEIQISLEADTGGGFSTVRTAYNYATRDANQNQGSASINGHVVTLSAGDEYRVRAAAVLDSSGANWSTNGCWLTIRTI